MLKRILSTVTLSWLLVLSASQAMAKDQFVILLPIDINQADELTLSRALSGVGPKKAQAIVQYRQEHGFFRSVDELTQVKGIGPGTLRKNISRIKVIEETTEPAEGLETEHPVTF